MNLTNIKHLSRLLFLRKIFWVFFEQIIYLKIKWNDTILISPFELYYIQIKCCLNQRVVLREWDKKSCGHREIAILKLLKIQVYFTGFFRNWNVLDLDVESFRWKCPQSVMKYYFGIILKELWKNIGNIYAEVEIPVASNLRPLCDNTFVTSNQ